MMSFVDSYSTKILSECGQVIGGGTPSKQRQDFWNGNIPWVSAKEMKQLEIFDSKLKITKLGLAESSAKMLPANSVLFVVRGSILYKNVPIAINRVPCTINQDMKAIVPNDDLNVEYLAYMLLGANDQLKNMVEEAGNTAGKLPTPSWSALKIPVPPLDEQRRIVARIEELTSRAEEARKLRQKTIKQISTQFFHVRRKLFESLSLEWPIKHLGKCGKVMGGGTPAKDCADYWNGEIPWISAKDMKSFIVSDSGLKITNKGLFKSSAKMIPANSVLFVVRGSILYRYVPVAINAMPCTINQDLKAIVPDEGINSVFLAHMLWGANDQLQNMVEEAGNTAGKLPTASWSAFEVPIPDSKTQQTVIKELQAFQKNLAELETLQEETAQELEVFHAALLAKAFQGEL
jgi:type I restriction enzyme S subunit